MDLLPKKRFGQHFLRDRAVLDRIVRLVEPAETDLLLEVGAGTGLLTVRLAQAGAPLYAVELDAEVIPVLRRTIETCPWVTIVPADILALDLPILLGNELPGRRLRGIGNLPYNIATAVIEKCLTSALPFHDLTFMTQMEVAERIVASPGSKTYGYLSVLCQHLARTRIAFKISPGSFLPPPKVMSALVVFHPHSPRPHPDQTRSVLEVARAAFGHRRKMLLNALRQCPAIAMHAETMLARAGVEATRRAEQLGVAEYERLARVHSEFF